MSSTMPVVEGTKEILDGICFLRIYILTENMKKKLEHATQTKRLKIGV